MSVLGDLGGGLIQASPYLLQGYGQGQLGGEQLRQSREQQQLEQLFKQMQLALEERQITQQGEIERSRGARDLYLAGERERSDEARDLLKIAYDPAQLSRLNPQQIASLLQNLQQLRPNQPLPFGRLEGPSPSIVPEGAEAAANAPPYMQEIFGVQPGRETRITGIPEFGPTEEELGKRASRLKTEVDTRAAEEDLRQKQATADATIREALAKASTAEQKALFQTALDFGDLTLKQKLADSLITDRTKQRQLDEKKFAAQERQWQQKFDQDERQLGRDEAIKRYNAETRRLAAGAGREEMTQLRMEFLQQQIDRGNQPKISPEQRAAFQKLLGQLYPADLVGRYTTTPEKKQAILDQIRALGIDPGIVDALAGTGGAPAAPAATPTTPAASEAKTWAEVPEALKREAIRLDRAGAAAIAAEEKALAVKENGAVAVRLLKRSINLLREERRKKGAAKPAGPIIRAR